MLEILIEYKYIFLSGFLTTLELFLLITLIGIPLGILLGVIGGRWKKEISQYIKAVHFITKVIPTLVLLFWMHYPLQSMFDIVIDPFWTVTFVLGFLHCIKIGHLLCTELEMLPKTYRETGMSLGLSSFQIVRYIELPILIRRILPQVLALEASMLEYTLFASYISVQDIFRVTQSINSMIYQPIPLYSLLIFFFLLILVPLQWMIYFFKKKYAVFSSELSQSL